MRPHHSRIRTVLVNGLADRFVQNPREATQAAQNPDGLTIA
jgi:hypothetical protein